MEGGSPLLKRMLTRHPHIVEARPSGGPNARRSHSAFLSVFGPPRNLQPHYNLAPTDTVDVVRATEQGRELAPVGWGLVPYWWKKLPRSMREPSQLRTSPCGAMRSAGAAASLPRAAFNEWTGTKAARRDLPPSLRTAAEEVVALRVAG